jgi:outer membrane protein assembly factor BamB
MTWRKIRDTSKMNQHGPHRTDNVHLVKELAAWPGFWVLRGGSSVRGHKIYGLDIESNQLIWTMSGLQPPEGLGWSYKRLPLLARATDLAVVATYVGRNRERVWLLALEPRTGALVWRRPVTWSHRRGGKKRYESTYVGIGTTGTHLVVMENRARQGEEPVLLWLDPATGEAVHECPAFVSEDPIQVAGGSIYFSCSGREQPGLYRVAAAPGATAVERVLEGSPSSLMTCAGKVYTITTDDRHEWRFVCLDAVTAETEGSQVLRWDEGSAWPRLLAIDPARPHHVIAQRDTQLWCLDLHSGETVWEHTFEYSTHVKQVLRTQHGALLNSDAGVEGLDLATGACTDLGIGGPIEAVVAAGDYVMTSHTFGSGSALYVAQGTEAAATHLEPVAGDEAWEENKLRELLPDLLTDPRDELKAAFGKAAGRGSLKTLAKTVRQITGILQTHQTVKAYLKALKAGELDHGPLDFIPLADLHQGFFLYPDLFGFGPDGRFFPGVLIAGEFGGVEFYLMWATGQVISLHHDASFSEMAFDVWGAVDGREGAFEREFPAQGGTIDIAQLVRFQQAFAAVEDTGDLARLDPLDFLPRTAEAFGWRLEQLRQRLTHHTALEFLGVHDEELAVLDALLADDS